MSDVLCVSLATRKGISAVTLTVDGYLKDKSVVKIKDEDILSSSYSCLIQTFITSLKMVRRYVDENSEINRVVFEVGSSTLIKWVENNYSKNSYHKLFFQALILLNEIPVLYSFSYNVKPFASMYLSNDVDTVKVSGLLEE